LGEAQPGDFDGATINSVSVSGTPATTVNVTDNDTLGVHFIIETSAGTDIYGTAGGADSATMCAAAESSSGSTIADGASTSPAPTTAVAADWDNVYWEVTYSQVQMADATRTISWSQFNIVVDYTANTNVTVDDFPAADGPEFGSSAPTVTHQKIVNPAHVNLRTYDGVGLFFGGIAPTIDVAAGDADLTIDDFPAAEGPSFTGQQPTVTHQTKISAGSPDALSFGDATIDKVVINDFVDPTTRAVSFDEKTPTVTEQISLTAGDPDGLSTSGQVPTLTHQTKLTAGAPDALVFGGDEPLLSSNPAPDSVLVQTDGKIPTVTHQINITAGAHDELSFGGDEPVISTNPEPDSVLVQTSGQVPTITHQINVTAGAHDELSTSGQVATLTHQTNIAAGDPDALSFGGDVISRVSISDIVSPTTRAVSFDGKTATLTEQVNLTAGAHDELSFGGDVISRVSVGDIVDPTTRAVSLSGQVPTLTHQVVVTAGAPDALSFGGDIPVAVLTKTAKPTTKAVSLSGKVPTLTEQVSLSAGSPDSLQTSSDAPQLIEATVLTAGAPDALSFGSTKPTLGIAFPAGDPDALSLSGQQPTCVESIVVSPSTGTAALSGQLFVPFTGFENPLTGSVLLAGVAPSTAIGARGTWIGNVDATTSVPTNVEQCDYSGFKVLPGSLKFTWNKYGVRKKSWESRHPSDLLHHAPHGVNRRKGSRRPEQEDSFVDQVDPEDL
jgi:hypothetical protein